MEIISGGGDPLATMVHRRKTVTFSSDSGTVTVFTITGEVMGSLLIARCTDTVVENGAVTSIELGGTTDKDALIVQTNPSLIQTGKWWTDATPLAGPVQVDALQIDWLLDEDMILTIIGGTDLTSGTIVFDVLYLPITDGAGLVAA